MLISDIKPYERNARHNDKAIPKVAESIRKFGLRGSIVLESRDNPVIVCGHTRVTTDDYAGCALKAVNLGADTDTTAAVAGGLAGIVYGIDSIPAEWIAKLRGKDVIDACLFA